MMPTYREQLVHQLQCPGAMTEQGATELVDAHRTELLSDTKNEVVAWLVKKAREGEDIARLASKVDRGAVRIFLGTGYYRDALDAHADAVLRADGQDYPGEVTALRGLVAALAAVAQHGDLDEVQKLLADHAARDDEAREAAKAADFFQPGHTYIRPHHGETITFVVQAVSTSPDGRTTVAHGWRRTPYTDGGWETTAADDFDGWTEAGGGR